MIADLFLSVLSHIGSWFIGLMPTWSEPSWVQSTADTITGWLSNVGSLGYFVPLGPLVAVFTLVLAAYGIGFAVRVVRIGASFITGGGGGAA